MGEYTSLAMGAATGLVVFISTIYYMNRKEKREREQESQGKFTMPQTEGKPAAEMARPR